MRTQMTVAEVIEVQQAVRRIADLYPRYREYFGAAHFGVIDEEEMDEELVDGLAADYADTLDNEATQPLDAVLRILESML